MRRLLDGLARRLWLVPTAIAVLASAALVAVTPAGGRLVPIVLLALLALLIVAIGVGLSGRDPGAEERARVMVDDPASVALLTRWLRRSRHFRFVGGLTGTVLGFGFIDNSPLPIAVGLLAGVSAGGALAEVHSLRRGRGHRRTADLARRRLGDYAARTDLVAASLIAAGALAATIAGLLGAGPDPSRAWLAGLATLAVVAIIVTMAWLVVQRPRPALGPDLRRADDLMRRLAATQGFTRPAIALAIVLLGRSLSGLGLTGPAVVLVLAVAAIAWWSAGRQSPNNLLAAASAVGAPTAPTATTT